MKPEFFRSYRQMAASVALILSAPALPPDFVALPYANPDAPTGGKLVTANVGSFDSLNPYILKGSVHWQMRYLMGESLMGRSLDEPFSLR